MGLLERVKKIVGNRPRRTGKKEEVDAPGTDGRNSPPSEGGMPGTLEEKKRERVSRLTPREHELYRLLLEGYTLKESARTLSVQYSTANTHMTSVYKKLGVRSRAELIIHYHNLDGEDKQAP